MAAVMPSDYAMMGGSQSVKQATIEVRRGFIRKVYSILTAQLMLTVAIAWPIQGMSLMWLQQHSWMMMASLIGSMVTLCAIPCCADITRKFPQNYMMLFTFTVFEAIVVGFISAMYTAGSVATAAAATVVIFTGLTFYACFTKTDCTEFGIYLYGALLCLIAFGFMIMIMNMFGIQTPMMVKLYQLCGMFIFCMFTIYDTQKVLGSWGGHKQEYSVDDYVFAALNIYLDIIQMFIYILEIIGTRKD
jgi:FtsH-binding integral membrane protein